MALEQTPTRTILRLRAVQERCGISRSLIYRLISEGKFPSPIRVTERSSGWIAAEIDSWIAERVAASRGTSEA